MPHPWLQVKKKILKLVLIFEWIKKTAGKKGSRNFKKFKMQAIVDENIGETCIKITGGCWE